MTESPKHNCWHLLRLNQNPTLKEMVLEGTLKCTSAFFCDHHIPATVPYIRGDHPNIGCRHDNPARCPIIIREKSTQR